MTRPRRGFKRQGGVFAREREPFSFARARTVLFHGSLRFRPEGGLAVCGGLNSEANPCTSGPDVGQTVQVEPFAVQPIT